ncbi:MAG: (2Fe-2S)-binding protein [Phycisphaerae bacterium]
MALNPDDIICYCFSVKRRKIETFCNVEKPKVPSQISECLSAGTGCGWCVPMLKKIHKRLCGEHIPWWRKTDDSPASPRDDENIDADTYRNSRKQYIAEGRGTPPPGETNGL